MPCPFCGERDDMFQHEMNHLRYEKENLANQMICLSQKNILLDEVIREQIKAIWDYVKSMKKPPEES